ncbi:hypothetical protein D3C81_1203170 [compost metagenome]
MQVGQVLVATGGPRANVVQQLLVDVEVRIHGPLAGADEFDVGRLVPDDVIATEVLHQHQHEERVGHAVQAATELGADIVAIETVQSHPHPHLTEVRTDVAHPYARADIGRVEIQGEAEQAGLAGQFAFLHGVHSEAAPGRSQRSG